MNIADQIEMLVDSGYDVMIHGRASDSCDRAGTARWVVEIDKYPHCVATQCEGSIDDALAIAVLNYFDTLDSGAIIP